MLQYIQNVIWKYLFNKVADNLERSTENDDECECMYSSNAISAIFKVHLSHYINFLMSFDPDMIHEYSPITNAFVSVPADMGQLNCAAFIAGILAGILDASKFVRDIMCTKILSPTRYIIEPLLLCNMLERQGDGSLGSSRRRRNPRQQPLDRQDGVSYQI
jgi:hypothetical protein